MVRIENEEVSVRIYRYLTSFLYIYIQYSCLETPVLVKSKLKSLNVVVLL